MSVVQGSGIPFRRTCAIVVLVVGIVVTVAGTFGPWAHSGTVDRNSYQLVGALRRFPLIHSDAVLALVGAWPCLGPLLMVPLVLLAFRLWRISGLVSVILGTLAMAPSVAALALVGGQQHLGVGLTTEGPLTVITGGALLIVAGALLLASHRRDVQVHLGRPGTELAGRSSQQYGVAPLEPHHSDG